MQDSNWITFLRVIVVRSKTNSSIIEPKKAPLLILRSQLVTKTYIYSNTALHSLWNRFLKKLQWGKKCLHNKYAALNIIGPMQQKEINILCGYPRYTTIWYLYQQNQKNKYKNHLQNQYIYKVKYSNCSWTQPTEKITSISSQKSSSSFNSIFCSYNLLF